MGTLTRPLLLFTPRFIIRGVKREIPYGVINREILVRDCYIVDNTSYIRELEMCRTPVFLRRLALPCSRHFAGVEPMPGISTPSARSVS